MGFCQYIGSPGNFGPVIRLQFTGLELLGINDCLLGQQTGCQLILTHFQLEQHNILIGMLGSIQCHIEGKSSLAHTRTGSNQDQVRFVQAGQTAVQIMEACGQTRQTAFTLCQFIQTIVYIQNDAFNG